MSYFEKDGDYGRDDPARREASARAGKGAETGDGAMVHAGGQEMVAANFWSDTSDPKLHTA